MKITKLIFIYWTVLGLTFALYQFGFTVNLRFTNESIPFSTVWQSAELHKAFKIYPDSELFFLFLAAFLGAIILPFLKTDPHRALLFGIVSLIGMAHFYFIMALIMVYAPWIVLNEFLGNLDAESYSDGIDQAGAAGLFLLFTFFTTLKYSWRLYKDSKKSKDHQLI